MKWREVLLDKSEVQITLWINIIATNKPSGLRRSNSFSALALIFDIRLSLRFCHLILSLIVGLNGMFADPAFGPNHPKFYGCV